MNRADTQFALQRFFDTLACASHADPILAAAYLEALSGYLRSLEEDLEEVDTWSVEEYERACEFVFHNARWIQNHAVAADTLAAAQSSFAAHRRVLIEQGLVLSSLEGRPATAYQYSDSGVPEFVADSPALTGCRAV